MRRTIYDAFDHTIFFMLFCFNFYSISCFCKHSNLRNKKEKEFACVTTEFFMDFLPIKKYHEIKKCDAVTAKSSKCLRFFVVVNKAVQSKQCLFMQIIKFIWSCIINVIGNYTIFNSCVHENNYSKSMLSNIRSNSFSLVFSPHIASMQINIE